MSKLTYNMVMITTGCPLGDASSFLVRVGEYARVSVVFQFVHILMYN